MSFTERLAHPDIISLVIAVIMLLLTIPLFMGKWGFLIAGWNTSSHEEKKKYDEKKLCRSMAIAFLILGILTLLLSVLQDVMWFILIYLVIVVVVTVLLIWYVNKKCRKD